MGLERVYTIEASDAQSKKRVSIGGVPFGAQSLQSVILFLGINYDYSYSYSYSYNIPRN